MNKLMLIYRENFALNQDHIYKVHAKERKTLQDISFS